MNNNGYVLLDTSKFETFISQRSNLLDRYRRINEQFERVVNNLQTDWQGNGASAFAEDARLVRANIGDIGDILHTMCDTLQDCLEVFQDRDGALGDANKNVIG